VRSLLQDSKAEVRAAALRVSETLFKGGDTSFDQDYAKLLKDSDPTVSLQALCTANLLKAPSSKDLLQTCAFGKAGGPGLKEIATMMMAPPRTWGPEYTPAQKSLLSKGDGIFRELCFACHNLDGRGTPVDGRPGVTLAPPLAGSKTVNGSKEGLIAVLLKGLAGPINGKTYESQMVAMESNNDEWIAGIGSYIRNSFGNKSGVITAQEVAALRKSLQDRKDPWTIDDLKQFGPPTLTNRSQWRLSASHNPDALAKAIDGDPDSRYDTRTPQTPDMWVGVELPAPAPVSGVRLDAGKSAGDYPREYVVEISEEGQKWIEVAKGEGKSGVLSISFETRPIKSMRIRQTGSVKGSFWSIHELDLLAPAPKPLAKN
jgi:mono/diheme cytochrome c family protein